jgi:antitoxin component of MazEF toxin-antitoxin module
VTREFRPDFAPAGSYSSTSQARITGNSLGLRLPKSVALEAQVDEGDTVDVSVKNGAIVIRPSRPSYSLAQLVAEIVVGVVIGLGVLVAIVVGVAVAF